IRFSLITVHSSLDTSLSDRGWLSFSDRFGQLPLHLILVDLFHRNARWFRVLRLRLRALDELLGALGDEEHVPELAIHAFGQTFHLVPPSVARPSRRSLRALSSFAVSSR